MSPNDYQPQNEVPLPEVPQIAPSDTTPAESQSAENTPTEETPVTVIQSSISVQTPTQPSVEAQAAPAVTVAPTYAPAATFSDIRPAQPTPTRSMSTPSPLPDAVFTDIKPAQAAPHHKPLAASQPTPVSNQPSSAQTPVATSSAPTAFPDIKNPHKTAVLIGVVGSIIALVGVAAVIFLLVLPSIGKIASSDLVSTTSADTNYLHPKQWKEATVGSTGGYGEKASGSNDYSAVIVSEKLSYLQSGVTKSNDKQISVFRQLMVKLNSASTAEATMKRTGGCDSVKDVNATESTIKNANSIGIFKITGICTKGKTLYKIAYYALLGNDGYARAITLVATEKSWKQNEAVFNKMLDSAEQA